MAQKPTIPKGTRDFSPSEVIKRNYIFDIVKKHFQTFGFQPIETPSFENSDTLMGKYGEEGDRLIFKILDSGEYFEKNLEKVLEIKLGEISAEITMFFLELLEIIREKYNDNSEWHEIVSFLEENIKSILYKSGKGQINKYRSILEDYILNQKNTISFKIINRSNFFSNENTFENFKEIELVEICGFASNYIFGIMSSKITSKKLTPKISEKALRYDLTVPFARYVVMHQNEIDFPFKRYQIQPVWRADRPQKGRFREFFQCDADVVGSNSLLQEVELVQLYDAVFAELKLEGVTIKLNNRKILAGIAEVIGAKQHLINFTVALDKLDKIGEVGVQKEMLEKGISEEAIAKAAPLFSLKGSNLEQLNILEQLLASSEEGLKGVDELKFIINTIEALGLKTATLGIDVTLARGLNYYTGAIFEVSAPENVKMGSIGGGGRYDDLTGIFGLKNVSGVGISFGLDRIYLVLEELGLFPEAIDQSLQVLCVNFGNTEALAALKLVTQLRNSGIKADLYPSATKMQKQMKYANNRNVPYVVLIGEQELADNSFVVKNMEQGTQQTYSFDTVESFVKEL